MVILLFNRMLFLILKNSKFNINAIEMSKVNDKSNLGPTLNYCNSSSSDDEE